MNLYQLTLTVQNNLENPGKKNEELQIGRDRQTQGQRKKKVPVSLQDVIRHFLFILDIFFFLKSDWLPTFGNKETYAGKS